MGAAAGCERPGVARRQEQDAQERLDARIAKAQGAGMLAFDLEGLLHLLKNLGPHLRVVTDFLW